MDNHLQENQAHHEDSHDLLTPIISVADFDGNGKVNAADIEDLTARSNSSDGDDLYHPLYDLDTNGIIDDADITIANETVGQEVPLIDRQIAQATQATMQYYGSGGLEQAIANGYIPFTQEFEGHGVHYFNFPLALEIAESPELNTNTPIGLNYDAEGNLVAVFYIRTPFDPQAALANPAAFLTIDPENDFAPTSFDGISAEDWHTHENFWTTGLGSLNPEEVYGFEEYVPIEATISRLENIDFQQFPESDRVFAPKFWMLHGWFHSLNPSGTFANLHPEVSLYAPQELGAHAGHGDDGHGMGHDGGHSEDGSGLIVGTDLNDGLHGTDEDNRINTFNGDDWIHGGLGDDSIWGGQGNDWLSGDYENADGGDDMLYGGPGSDAIYGRVGNDRIFGGTGDDYLVGGEGDDLIRGGLGYDNLIGNAGADRFVLVPGEGTDTIHDFAIGEDLIVLYGGIGVGDISINQSSDRTILDANGETLAVLSGINADDLSTASNDIFIVA